MTVPVPITVKHPYGYLVAGTAFPKVLELQDILTEFLKYQTPLMMHGPQ